MTLGGSEPPDESHLYGLYRILGGLRTANQALYEMGQPGNVTKLEVGDE